MLDSQQKRKVRNIAYHPVTLVVLAALVLIVLHSTWLVYQKKSASEKMKNISMARTKELRLRDNQLKSNISRLGTDVGVEEEIRSKFSVAKEKENMVILVGDTGSKESATSTEKNFWQRLWSFLSK